MIIIKKSEHFWDFKCTE